MTFITIYGLNWMKTVEEDMTRNRSTDYLDLTAENICSVIELLITGTHFLHPVCIIGSTINTFKMRVSFDLKSRAVKFKVCYCDSRHYMVKAFGYSCQSCL